MSINKSNKRIPQLYMISTKEDQDTIKITFKKYIQWGSTQPEILMSALYEKHI